MGRGLLREANRRRHRNRQAAPFAAAQGGRFAAAGTIEAETLQLAWFVERGFQQASRIALTKFCRSNNSCRDALPYHFWLATTLKLFESGFESFAHRRNCLGVEPSRSHK
jgi:hypothetical protein